MSNPINQLTKRLGALTQKQLDAMVELMTGEEFERAWLDADRLAGNNSLFPPELDAVVAQLATATNEHEICTFIADDLTLLHRAEVAGIEDEPFIARLAEAYANGRCGADIAG